MYFAHAVTWERSKLPTCRLYNDLLFLMLCRVFAYYTTITRQRSIFRKRTQEKMTTSTTLEDDHSSCDKAMDYYSFAPSSGGES